MRYLDSNVFIYAAALKPSESQASKSRSVLIDMADGKFEAATSTLTWDETVWLVKKSSGMSGAAEEGKRFLQLPNLKLLSINENTIRRAQSIIEEYKLDPRDAIHAACCLENGIKEIVSDDPDFDAVKGIRRLAIDTFR